MRRLHIFHRSWLSRTLVGDLRGRNGR
jgi:hypothetical protein